MHQRMELVQAFCFVEKFLIWRVEIPNGHKMIIVEFALTDEGVTKANK